MMESIDLRVRQVEVPPALAELLEALAELPAVLESALQDLAESKRDYALAEQDCRQKEGAWRLAWLSQEGVVTVDPTTGKFNAKYTELQLAALVANDAGLEQKRVMAGRMEKARAAAESRVESARQRLSAVRASVRLLAALVEVSR